MLNMLMLQRTLQQEVEEDQYKIVCYFTNWAVQRYAKLVANHWGFKLFYFILIVRKGPDLDRWYRNTWIPACAVTSYTASPI